MSKISFAWTDMTDPTSFVLSWNDITAIHLDGKELIYNTHVLSTMEKDIRAMEKQIDEKKRTD